MQAFALLVRAQQMLTARLDRSEHGGEAATEAPADMAGPDTVPRQHLFKMLQVVASPTTRRLLRFREAFGGQDTRRHTSTAPCFPRVYHLAACQCVKQCNLQLVDSYDTEITTSNAGI